MTKWEWRNTAGNLWVLGEWKYPPDHEYKCYERIRCLLWHIHKMGSSGLMDTLLASQGNDQILADSQWYWQQIDGTRSGDFPTMEAAKADAEERACESL